MATRTTMLAELRYRLGEAAASVWLDAELKAYIDAGIKGLYPAYFQFKVGVTLANDGPVQSTPTGARNLYAVGVIRDGATRVRPIRGWTEGEGEAIVPKLGIDGQQLVWSWTDGWDAPAADSTPLTVPLEAEQAVLMRAQISALEKVLSSRTKAEKYFAVQARQGITEQDIADAIDTLHVSLKELLDRAAPRPEPVK